VSLLESVSLVIDFFFPVPVFSVLCPVAQVRGTERNIVQEKEHAEELKKQQRTQEESKIKRMQLLAQQQADKQLSRLLEKPSALTPTYQDVDSSTSAAAALNVEQQGSEVRVFFICFLCWSTL
jgi:hypothetical protein